MASPTKAELWTMIANLVKLIDEFWKFGADNTPNFVDLEDTLVQSLEGNSTGSISQYVQTWRGEINSRYDAGRASLVQLFTDLARFGYSINTQGLQEREILVEIARAMDGLSETVKARDFTYGVLVAGGSNVGSSTVLRNTKDEHGNDLEIAVPGVQRIEVVQDGNMGATPGAEVVKIFGQGNPRIDRIQYGDSTDEVVLNTTLASSGNRNAQNGRNFLVNGSFDSLETGTSLSKDEQTGWTL